MCVLEINLHLYLIDFLFKEMLNNYISIPANPKRNIRYGEDMNILNGSVHNIKLYCNIPRFPAPAFGGYFDARMK